MGGCRDRGLTPVKPETNGSRYRSARNRDDISFPLRGKIIVLIIYSRMRKRFSLIFSWEFGVDSHLIHSLIDFLKDLVKLLKWMNEWRNNCGFLERFLKCFTTSACNITQAFFDRILQWFNEGKSNGHSICYLYGTLEPLHPIYLRARDLRIVDGDSLFRG